MRKIIAVMVCGIFFAAQVVSAQGFQVSVQVFKRDTSFTSIAVDDEDNVYAGTNGKSIWKYDQRSWKDWGAGLGFPAFKKCNIRQIACSGNNIWVASSGYVLFLGSGEAGNNNNFYGGVHRIDKTLPYKRFYFKGRPVLGQMVNPGPPTRNILGVCVDSLGTAWCAGSYHDSLTYPAFLNYNARYHFAPGAVGRFSGDNFSFITGADLPDPTGISIGVGNNYQTENYSIGKRRTCRSVIQANGEVWVGSDGYSAASLMTAGILRYTLSGAYIGKYDQNNTPVPFGLTNNDFGPWAMYKDTKGRVWVAMNGTKGIAVFDSTGWHYIGVPPNIAAASIFRPNAIGGGSTGEVFFGTNNGLLMYKGKGDYSSDTSYTVFTTTQGLSSNSIFGVTIGRDQSIWIATTAGINRIQRGDLFVYNLKPTTLTITVTDNDAFRRPVLRYDSRAPQDILNKDTLLIAADGSRATIFKWAGVTPNNMKLRIAQDPDGQNPDQFGSFFLRYLTPSNDSIRLQYTHPKFIDELYTVSNDGGRNVRLQVVDTTVSPVKVVLDIPVKFVLPPVLMIHGVWSSVQSFKKMDESLRDVLSNYKKPWMRLRIWYANDRHGEPLSSQYDYRYEVPSGIDRLLEGCVANKMSAGKVDILAHSRGGIFSRLYLQENFVGYRKDINKLITINTPHAGSQTANLALDKRKLILVKYRPILGFSIDTSKTLGQVFRGFSLEDYDDINGAEELKVNAPAIFSTLNGPGNLNKNTTYSHAVIGRQLFGQAVPFPDILNGGLLQGAMNMRLRLLQGLMAYGAQTADDVLKAIYNGEFNDIVVPESSQQGGLNESNVSRFPGVNVAHSNKRLAFGLIEVARGVLDIPVVHSRINDLLRANPNGGLFGTSGFAPPDLRNGYTFLKPNPFFLLGSSDNGTTGGRTYSDIRIRIDSTLNGSTVNAGDTLMVKVSKNNLDTMVLAYSGKTIDVFSDVHFNTDTVFKFRIPREATGQIAIEAYGFNGGEAAYDSIYVNIGLPASVVLDSIRIDRTPWADSMIRVVQGDSVTYSVNGYYSDGIVREITYLTPFTKTVLDGNISTPGINRVKGLVVGFDELRVSFQGKVDSIPAEVLPVRTYSPPVVIPVSFTGISARYTGDKIKISWNTAQEINNHHFEVQHSTTGNGFVTIGTVAAAGLALGSSYSFDHPDYVMGRNYYRIKQVDIDGTASYTTIVSVLVDGKQQLIIYPNPADDKIDIQFTGTVQKPRMLRVVNTWGQVLLQQNLPVNTTRTTLPLLNLLPGIYTIEVFGEKDERIAAEKFIKK